VAEAAEGSTFPEMFLPFLRDLYNLRQQNPQGFSMISELVLVGREKIILTSGAFPWAIGPRLC
jgi:hypothetical protein